MKPQDLEALRFLPLDRIFESRFFNAIPGNLQLTDTTLLAGASTAVAVELVRCGELMMRDFFPGAFPQPHE